MKPYYDKDGITIFHADCRDVLPSLVADVLVTDPPFGVEFNGKKTKHTNRNGGYLGQDDPKIGPDVVRSLLPIVKRGAVFTGTRHLFDYPRPDDLGAIFCASGSGFGQWGFTCFHAVLFYGKPPHNFAPSSIESFETAVECNHPCPKPLGWMSWLVNRTCDENDV